MELIKNSGVNVTEKSFWIDPNGKLYDIEATHEGWAQDHYEEVKQYLEPETIEEVEELKKDPEEYQEWLDGDYSGDFLVNQLIEKGWVRFLIYNFGSNQNQSIVFNVWSTDDLFNVDKIIWNFITPTIKEVRCNIMSEDRDCVMDVNEVVDKGLQKAIQQCKRKIGLGIKKEGIILHPLRKIAKQESITDKKTKVKKRDPKKQVTADDIFDFLDKLEEEKIDWKFVAIPIKDIKPSQKEIKREKVEDIKKSIDKAKEMDPCYVDKDNNLADGHHRLVAFKEKYGEDYHLACVRIDATTDKIFKLMEEMNDGNEKKAGGPFNCKGIPWRIKSKKVTSLSIPENWEQTDYKTKDYEVWKGGNDWEVAYAYIAIIRIESKHRNDEGSKRILIQVNFDQFDNGAESNDCIKGKNNKEKDEWGEEAIKIWMRCIKEVRPDYTPNYEDIVQALESEEMKPYVKEYQIDTLEWKEVKAMTEKARLVGDTIALDNKIYSIKIDDTEDGQVKIFIFNPSKSYYIATINTIFSNRRNKYIVADIWVSETLLRRGIATCLFSYTKNYIEQKYSKELMHSSILSDDGEAWKNSLSIKLSKKVLALLLRKTSVKIAGFKKKGSYPKTDIFSQFPKPAYFEKEDKDGNLIFDVASDKIPPDEHSYWTDPEQLLRGNDGTYNIFTDVIVHEVIFNDQGLKIMEGETTINTIEPIVLYLVQEKGWSLTDAIMASADTCGACGRILIAELEGEIYDDSQEHCCCKYCPAIRSEEGLNYVSDRLYEKDDFVFNKEGIKSPVMEKLDYGENIEDELLEKEAEELYLKSSQL